MAFQRRITADVKALQSRIDSIAAEVARGTEAERLAAVADLGRLAPLVLAILNTRPRGRRLAVPAPLQLQVIRRLIADHSSAEGVHRWLQAQPGGRVPRSTFHRFAQDADAAHRQLVLGFLGRGSAVA